MAGRGVLGRVSGETRHTDPSASIIEHLQVLLNTHSGDAGTVPDFGLKDFTDTVHELPDNTLTFLESVRQLILRYEPRLRNVTVRLVDTDNPLTLSFEIVARLNDEKRTMLRLQSSMGPGGHFTVKS